MSFQFGRKTSRKESNSGLFKINLPTEFDRTAFYSNSIFNLTNKSKVLLIKETNRIFNEEKLVESIFRFDEKVKLRTHLRKVQVEKFRIESLKFDEVERCRFTVG